MKTLITILLCLVALNDFSAPVPVVPIGLANPRFGIVSTMSSTDYVAIEIAGKPHGIALANLSSAITNGSVVSITVLNVTSNVLVTIINATNTALIADINNVSNYLYGLISTNVTVAAGTNVIVGTNVVGNQTVYTVSSALNTNAVGTNTAGILASNNVRVAAGANVTVSTGNSGGLMIYTVASPNAVTNGTNIATSNATVKPVFLDVSGNQVRFLSLEQGSNTVVFMTPTSIVLNASSAGGGSLSGSPAFVNLSPQAAKRATTNFCGIDAGWQDWELIYYKTNAEGSIASLSSTFQFVMPSDYATNTMSVAVYSLLLQTNGAATSNTIFRVSFIRAASGDSTDLHTASFSTAVSGTNTWTASGTGTNKMQRLSIPLGTQALGSNDLCILKIDRDAVNDTFGGATAVVGLRMEYTR